MINNCSEEILCVPLTTSTFLGGRDHITCPKARADIKVFSPKRFRQYGTIECPQSGYNIPSRSPGLVHSHKHACALAQYNMEGRVSPDVVALISWHLGSGCRKIKNSLSSLAIRHICNEPGTDYMKLRLKQ